MATATKICKVCGAEYPYCKTELKPGVFRYQDVACCPEHGTIYLSSILESRSKAADKEESSQSSKDEFINLMLVADQDDEEYDDFEEEDEEEEDEDE